MPAIKSSSFLMKTNNRAFHKTMAAPTRPLSPVFPEPEPELLPSGRSIDELFEDDDGDDQDMPTTAPPPSRRRPTPTRAATRTPPRSRRADSAISSYGGIQRVARPSVFNMGQPRRRRTTNRDSVLSAAAVSIAVPLAPLTNRPANILTAPSPRGPSARAVELEAARAMDNENRDLALQAQKAHDAPLQASYWRQTAAVEAHNNERLRHNAQISRRKAILRHELGVDRLNQEEIDSECLWTMQKMEAPKKDKEIRWRESRGGYGEKRMIGGFKI